MICPYCGAVVKQEDKNCPYCDGELPSIAPENKSDTSAGHARQHSVSGDKELLQLKKHPSTAMMWVFAICSLGFYGMYWYGIRAGALNRLKSRKKLSSIVAWMPLNLATLAIVVECFISNEIDYVFELDGMSMLISIAIMVVAALICVWMSFRVRQMLLDHITASGAESSIAVSKSLTHRRGFVYLQSVIDEMFEQGVM